MEQAREDKRVVRIATNTKNLFIPGRAKSSDMGVFLLQILLIKLVAN
jgi:hypothetical protein